MVISLQRPFRYAERLRRDLGETYGIRAKHEAATHLQTISSLLLSPLPSLRRLTILHILLQPRPLLPLRA